ncbi:PREDICTED: single-stranded DNA-binding protein, mitochondrial-like [Tarenaya hassleriana]|uniref:single-stranded DNA-binding protein, mitochondrial-like n=1 Tax=Tarenaya hassleriana TaxID=28532 RepID=UPI00053C6110|nr:PREDICTED: single-stranded DNA-binding protein, mitochondrial-like [Tarenaya hassleriana]
MANSVATFSRTLCRLLLSSPRFSQVSKPFCTNNIPSREESDSDELAVNSDIESSPETAFHSPSQQSGEERALVENPLENGLDGGIYKAILVGQAGQIPLQKKLKSGKAVTIFSVATGGLRNNRREYANSYPVQWHRVCIYPERLADLVLKNVQLGTTLYLEGNLETKVFSDPVTGIVRHIREVAIRRNGRVVFLGKEGEMQQPGPWELRNVGYF